MSYSKKKRVISGLQLSISPSLSNPLNEITIDQQIKEAIVKNTENIFNFCPECGWKLNKIIRFCPECGFDLRED